MHVHAIKTGEDQSRASAGHLNEKQQVKKGVAGFEDNRAETIYQRKLNAAVSGQSGQPLQRQILGESGFVKNKDLAERHDLRDTILGFTPPTVNSRQIRQGSDVVNAFKGANALVEVQQTGDEEFSAKVGIVPTNNVGYLMYLPTAGPWIKDDARKDGLLALLGERDNEKNPTNVIKLEVTGVGGYQQLEKQVEKHESVHAQDNLNIRDGILKPWDAKLTDMKKHGMIFKGKTAVEATGKLWAFAGGTLDEKAEEVTDAWIHLSNQYHKHEEGKTKMHPKSGVNENQTEATIIYFLTVK